MKPPILLAITYFGPIQYYAKWVSDHPIFLEARENYPKQTFRNRCIIASANGRLNLTVPVVREERIKIPIREVRIDYSSPWQKNHLRALESAYRKSPFFDFYIDDLLPFFRKRPVFLFDLDLEILHALFAILKISNEIRLTREYLAGSNNPLDFRGSISPGNKQSDPTFSPPLYSQNFSEKCGFLENLSILDLLFQTGPEAADLLRESWKPEGIEFS